MTNISKGSNGKCRLDKDCILAKPMPPNGEIISHGVSGAGSAGANVILIDVFRAVPTAIAILKKNPKSYFMTSDESLIVSSNPSFLRIGKPFLGSGVTYDAPNSPTRVSQLEISGRNIIHRTAGCGGCLDALVNPSIVLLCSISNVQATSQFVAQHGGSWEIIAAGHQAKIPVEEDNLCAAALVSGNPVSYIQEHAKGLRQAPGADRFSKDSFEYPLTDLDFCLDTLQIPLIITAKPSGMVWSLEIHKE